MSIEHRNGRRHQPSDCQDADDPHELRCKADRDKFHAVATEKLTEHFPTQAGKPVTSSRNQHGGWRSVVVARNSLCGAL